MKKIMMTLAAVCVAATMNAQWYVGGGLGINSSKTGDTKTTNFQIRPEVGYTLNDNWAVGVALGYGYEKEGNVKTSDFTINPYARYTFAKLEKVNFFVDGGVFYTFEKNGEADSQKFNKFGIGLKPGVAVNLNDKVSFVAHIGDLGWSNKKSKADGAKATNDFGLNANLTSVDFGLYFNF